MGKGGLEPPRLAAHAPKACASAYSATPPGEAEPVRRVARDAGEEPQAASSGSAGRPGQAPSPEAITAGSNGARTPLRAGPPDRMRRPLPGMSAGLQPRCHRRDTASRTEAVAFAAELARRGLRPEVPILVLSAHPHPQSQVRQIGAEGCLGKPFKLRRLLDEVARLARPDSPRRPREHIYAHQQPAQATPGVCG